MKKEERIAKIKRKPDDVPPRTLRLWRARMGLSIDELAELTGYKPSTLYAYEVDEAPIRRWWKYIMIGIEAEREVKRRRALAALQK